MDRLRDAAADAINNLTGQADGALGDAAGRAEGLVGDVAGQGEGAATDAVDNVQNVQNEVEGQLDQTTGGVPQDLGGALGSAGDLLRKVTGG